MKIYMLGGGAMGTLYGTTLIMNNQYVTFFDAWPVLLEQVKKEPYAERIHNDRKIEKIPVTVKELDGKTQYEPADFIIIFVKTAMTENTINLAKQMNLANEKTIVLTCQGGFENSKFISQMVPAENILVGCTCSFTKSAGIMKITNFQLQESQVWPYKCQNNQPNEYCQKVVQELPFIQLKMSPGAIADVYKMQLYYTANIAVSAICDIPFGPVNDSPYGHQLLMHLADECAEVAEANGVPKDLFNKQIARDTVIDLAKVSAPHLGSMNADLKNKRVTEIEGTSGALIRMGKEHNIQLPYTEAVYCIVKLLEQK